MLQARLKDVGTPLAGQVGPYSQQHCVGKAQALRYPVNRPSIPPAYRAFCVDASGRIYRSHVLDCETDEQAIAEARRFVDGHGVQLWDGSRKIADFPSALQILAMPPRPLSPCLGRT